MSDTYGLGEHGWPFVEAETSLASKWAELSVLGQSQLSKNGYIQTQTTKFSIGLHLLPEADIKDRQTKEHRTGDSWHETIFFQSSRMMAFGYLPQRYQ